MIICTLYLATPSTKYRKCMGTYSSSFVIHVDTDTDAIFPSWTIMPRIIQQAVLGRGPFYFFF